MRCASVCWRKLVHQPPIAIDHRDVDKAPADVDAAEVHAEAAEVHGAHRAQRIRLVGRHGDADGDRHRGVLSRSRVAFVCRRPLVSAKTRGGCCRPPEATAQALKLLSGSGLRCRARIPPAGAPRGVCILQGVSPTQRALRTLTLPPDRSTSCRCGKSRRPPDHRQGRGAETDQQRRALSQPQALVAGRLDRGPATGSSRRASTAPVRRPTCRTPSLGCMTTPPFRAADDGGLAPMPAR